jgi:perosamine synthetase
MCVTNSRKLYDEMAMLKNHGMSKEKKYWHEKPGYNFRLTNLQAAIGVAQLERIEEMLLVRKEYEKKYEEILQNFYMHLTFQKNLPDRKRVVWLVCAQTDTNKLRDRLYDELQAIKIDVRKVFYPLSEMPPFKRFSSKECFVAKKISECGISFPTFNNFRRLDDIINKVNDRYGSKDN